MQEIVQDETMFLGVLKELVIDRDYTPPVTPTPESSSTSPSQPQ